MTDEEILKTFKRYFAYVNSKIWIEDSKISCPTAKIGNMKFKKLPIAFKYVKDFSLSYGVTIKGDFTTLEGCPTEVVYISVANNKLKSLEYFPKIIKDQIWVQDNYLTSLIGLPERCGSQLDISSNELTNLIGGPKYVEAEYYAFNNLNLTSLEGCPDFAAEFQITYNKNLPLLRLVKMTVQLDKNYFGTQIFTGDDNMTDLEHIIMKYQDTGNDKDLLPMKQRILACQKDLMNSGFVGNARW